MYNKELWQQCIAFHRHECPGLAIGYKVCEAARKKLNITDSIDEEIVCITENDACGVDAIQYILGCSLGKGNLIYRDRGKSAYSFFNRNTGESIRMVLKPSDDQMTREERQNFILNANIDDLFEYKAPQYELPTKAKLFNKITCQICGETATENKIRIYHEKHVCLDCYAEYTRGWN